MNRYDSVNGGWPQGQLPKMTGPEALRAAKALRAMFVKGPYQGEWRVGRGNHRSYRRRGRGFWIVNPGQGWKHFVHDISHSVFRELHPNAKPHAPGHAYVERKMVQHVMESGWLEGRLQDKPKAKPVPADARRVRYERIKARVAAWQAKERRAKNALAKLTRRLAYYERKLEATVHGDMGHAVS